MFGTSRRDGCEPRRGVRAERACVVWVGVKRAGWDAGGEHVPINAPALPPQTNRR